MIPSFVRISKVRSFLLCALVCGAVGGGGDVSAQDVLSLKGGGQLEGQLLSMQDGVLKFGFAAAQGEVLTLKFDRILTMESQQAHSWWLGDGTVLDGIASSSSPGSIAILVAEGERITVSLDGVTAINPKLSEDIVSTEKASEVAQSKQIATLSLGGRLNDGNSRDKSVSASGNYEIKYKKQRFTIRADWNYAEDSGVVSVRNSTASLKYDYFFNSRLFTYLSSRFEGDGRLDLKLRSALGAGLGVQFLDAKSDAWPLTVYEEFGVSFLDEDYKGESDDRFASMRLSGKVNWSISKRVEFFHFHEFFQSLEQNNIANARAESGFRIKLVGNLFVTSQVNFRWNNTPSGGKVRKDTEYIMGFGTHIEF